jgi:hypothetical protein
LPGQTNAQLTLNQLTASRAGQYQVTASNTLGLATNIATLTVRAKADLRITEVHSSQAAGASVPTADWWELTSFESQPVSLAGWRFNDNEGALANPFVLGPVTIAPGESIVFVENLSAAQFRNWWGTNLPPALQIITYNASGLGLGAGGDGVRLWNNTTTNATDTIASVDFGAATPGVTFNYDPTTGVFGMPSRLDVNGTFAAAASPGDIGSPGRIIAPATSPTLRARLVNGKMRIEFDAVAGHRYTLETRDDLNDNWTRTPETIEATQNGQLAFETDPTAAARFYRVTVE